MLDLYSIVCPFLSLNVTFCIYFSLLDIFHVSHATSTCVCFILWPWPDRQTPKRDHPEGCLQFHVILFYRRKTNSFFYIGEFPTGPHQISYLSVLIFLQCRIEHCALSNLSFLSLDVVPAAATASAYEVIKMFWNPFYVGSSAKVKSTHCGAFSNLRVEPPHLSRPRVECQSGGWVRVKWLNIIAVTQLWLGSAAFLSKGWWRCRPQRPKQPFTKQQMQNNSMCCHGKQKPQNAQQVLIKSGEKQTRLDKYQAPETEAELKQNVRASANTEQTAECGAWDSEEKFIRYHWASRRRWPTPNN